MKPILVLSLMLSFSALAENILVRLDPNGGELSANAIVVGYGHRYGKMSNLYPSDNAENFTNLRGTLDANVFTVKDDNRQGASMSFRNFFTKPLETVIVPDSDYTYVLEVLELEGAPMLKTGNTEFGDSQLSLDQLTIDKVGTYFIAKKGRDISDPTNSDTDYLERAYFYCKAGESYSIKFRVSLFSGNMVNAGNFSYVAPGVGLNVGLPTPKREGHEFLGWFAEDGNKVEPNTTLVSRKDEHTLTAEWLDLGFDIVGKDRPRVGKPLSVTIAESLDPSYSIAWYRGDVREDYDTTPIAETDKYTLKSEDFGHWIKAVLSKNGEVACSQKLWISKLPVVYVDTDDGKGITVKTEYKPAKLRIQGNESFKEQYNGVTEIKGRGNTSWGFPKKPYKLKLDKKTDLFGYGKNKHWVLLSNWLDESFMRNRLASDLAKELGIVGMDMQWVDVIFNGVYQGNYMLGEHIRVDSNRIDVYDWSKDIDDTKNGHEETDLAWLDKAEDVDFSGGYIFELSNEYDEVSKFTTQHGWKVMVNTPEYAATSEKMFGYMQELWNGFEEACRSADGKNTKGVHFSEIADMDSMVAFWLVNEVLGNDDAIWKSRYAYKQKGEKLKFGPVWDFDWGCGSTAVGVGNNNQWILAKQDNVYNIYREWLDNPEFCARAFDMYHERVRPFMIEFLADGGEYDKRAEYLRESGLSDDQFWGPDNGVNAYFSDGIKKEQRGFKKDIEVFKQYLKDRLAWLDTQFVSKTGLMKAVKTTVSAAPLSSAELEEYAWAEETFENETFVDIKGKLNGKAANGKNSVRECYVMGIDPADKNAKLLAEIVVKDGKPEVKWKPNLGTKRKYRVLGSETLNGEWHEQRDGDKFFKVDVSLP